MSLTPIETIVRWLGGLLAYATLGAVFYGIWRGTQRQAGRITGQMGRYLRSSWFYLVTSAIFFGICILGWIPLPLVVSQQVHIWALGAGALLYFPGMGLALWPGWRWAGITSFRLVLVPNCLPASSWSNGLFAIVRHPMYAGIILAAFGSLLIYHTWTTVFFACFAPALFFRSRRRKPPWRRNLGSNGRNTASVSQPSCQD